MSYSVKAALTLSLISMSLAACTKGFDTGSTAIPVSPPVIKKVTRETYLSGQQFCATYADITSKEYGKYVTVPMDYNHPDKGSLEIYVYTNKPFDPSKPSYIFVDGGPGQNTHGEMPNYLGERYNELRFDQRGLGCSAPETYDIYQNADLYSSENNIRDMEMIRKAYGIEKWSVHGLSYGTVPATMYGSKYPEITRSVVLEGVFGDAKKIHLMSYKLDKVNLVVKTLNEVQKKSFAQLMREQSQDTETVISIVFQLFYADTGMRTLASYLKVIIETDGTIRRDILQTVRTKMEERENKYPNPQQPMAVDQNILQIIYCKNLDYRNKPAEAYIYREETGFEARVLATSNNGEACDTLGVTVDKESKYEIGQYPVKSPVYYFQGSHDGATMATGAIDHWKKVPQKDSYFLMAQKGGHSPNLTRLEAKSSLVRMAESALFYKALEAEPLAQSDLNDINVSVPVDEVWKLYLSPQTDDMSKDMDGIGRIQEASI